MLGSFFCHFVLLLISALKMLFSISLSLLFSSFHQQHFPSLCIINIRIMESPLHKHKWEDERERLGGLEDVMKWSNKKGFHLDDELALCSMTLFNISLVSLIEHV